MEEFETYLSETRFSHYENMIRLTSRSIKWDKGYIALCLFNSIMFGSSALKAFAENRTLSFSLLVFTSLAWLLVIFITIKSIKSKRIDLNANIKLRDEELKKLDYPAYIKNQRKNKLKQLNHGIFRRIFSKN